MLVLTAVIGGGLVTGSSRISGNQIFVTTSYRSAAVAVTRTLGEGQLRGVLSARLDPPKKSPPEDRSISFAQTGHEAMKRRMMEWDG